MMRARYHNAETNEYSSGPWTSDVTQRVRNNPPAAPTELSLTETTSKDQTTSIDLAWTAPSHDDLTGYRIWRGATADSLTVLVQDTGNTATSYTDTTTETDNTYVYAVTALSLDGDSPRSGTATVAQTTITTRDEPQEEDDLDNTLGTVSGLSVDPGSTLVVLTWTALDNDAVTEYQVLRGTSTDDLAVIGTATAPVYADGPVSPETTYYYAVRARSTNGYGPTSAAVDATTTAAVVTEEDELIADTQQSSYTLVSNLGNPTKTSSIEAGNFGTSAFRPEQSFQTGPHSAGYTVTEIQALVASITGTNIGPTVHIHTHNGLSGFNAGPGQRLHGFTEDTGFTVGSTVSFTSTEGAVTLSPNTHYWLVFRMSAVDTVSKYKLAEAATHPASADRCGEHNWNIDSSAQRGTFSLGTTNRVGTLSDHHNAALVAIVGSQVGGSGSGQICDDTKISMGKTAKGALQTGADKDWFAVTLEANVDYQFDMFTSIDGGGNSLVSGGINGVYNSSGVAQTVHLIEVEPSIALPHETDHTIAPTIWYEKRRAYFEPTVGGTYYLEVGPDSHDSAGLAGGTYAQSQPTYTVRVREG